MADGEGFEAFVLASGSRLHVTAYLLTRDHGRADDLVQTALARVWPVWHRVQGDAEPYVRKVLVNAFLSSRRRRWWGEHPVEALPERAAPDGGPGVDERIDLASALDRLPPRQRAVVVLRFVEDRTERDVAELLGCGVGTVKSQASKALAKLRADETLSVGSRAGGES